MSQTKVKEFHKKFGIDYDGPPRLMSVDEWESRLDHIFEELDETISAFRESDLEGTVDGLGDLLYLILGNFNLMGVDSAEVFRRIHEANMRKVSVVGEKKQGIVKPPGWKKPTYSDMLP